MSDIIEKFLGKDVVSERFVIKTFNLTDITFNQGKYKELVRSEIKRLNKNKKNTFKFEFYKRTLLPPNIVDIIGDFLCK